MMNGKTVCRCAGILLAVLVYAGCSGMAASAEEYFAIGMAYYDIGKFAEAEKWFNRAKAANKTKTASEYNLGRIAFETGRYTDAAKYFETILKKDPKNVLALKAAAYTRIKTGEIPLAEKHYRALLALVPESADDGYNYALVLFAMEKYADAEVVLASNKFALEDNNDMLLLYARALQKQDKIEAVDQYAKWLASNQDAKVRYEYAQLLEGQQLYARALEEYRSALAGLAPDSTEPDKNQLRFTIAKLLLVADSESDEGITEMQTAVTEGFGNIEAMEALLTEPKISDANKEALRALINKAQSALDAAEAVENASSNDASEAQVEAGSDSTGE